MITRSWIRKLFARTPHTTRKAPARRRTRLSLEVLEDRTVPSTLTVNSLLDNTTAGDGLVTLREAILAANNDTTTDLGETGSGADTILFQSGLTGTIPLALGQLVIDQDLTITGPGASSLTVSGEHVSRVFQIFSATVSISDLTIANGNGAGSNGGGLRNDSGNVTLDNCILTGNSAPSGGAIHTGSTGSGASLTVNNSTFSGNTAPSHGGAININDGTVTVHNSTFSGNTAFKGGAIYILVATVLVSNSTFSGNSAGSFGGGIFFHASSLTVSNSTLSGNSAPGGGGIFRENGTATLNNTIVANSPSGGNLLGSFNGSHNLFGSLSLAPLANYGGPTPTMALLPGSPAINAGDNALVPSGVTTDQRGPGFARISGSTVDIGAYEDQAPTITVPGAQTAYEDVDKAISGISVADVDSSSLTVTLAVDHGTLTLGTTAGLSVTGNGTGAVSLSGSIADLNAALASLVYRGALNFGGDDTLSITASDGSLSTSGSVAIYVKSAFEQAADLQAQVNALRDAGVLNEGQANSLNVKLNLRGNDGDGSKVQSFLDEVSAFLDAGILTQAQADALLGPGNFLLLSVTRR